MRVKCPRCHRTDVYVTTSAYNPDIAPRGDMAELVNPHHKGGLTYGTVMGSPSISASLMECCDCGGLLTFGGRLIVLPDETVEEICYVCDKCGKTGFGSKAGGMAHERHCKGN